MTGSLPSLEALKTQARALRASLAAQSREVSHSQALELIAAAQGYRDWNTLHAAIGNGPRPPVQVGQRVRGSYLGQAFNAEVIGVAAISDGCYRVTLDFDEAVDVVVFDSFSNFRKRVNKVVDPSGISLDRTSDGRPHLILEL